MVEVNSMGMTLCDLNENLDCLDDIYQRKFNIIYASVGQLAFPQFTLKQKIRYNKLQESLMLTKSLDCTEVSFSFARKRYFIFTQDELIKCLQTIGIRMFQDQGNKLNCIRPIVCLPCLIMPNVSLSPISWIETR